jgi:hypothetical protein
MLQTAEEIALLACAQEPGIRDPRRSEYGIDNIITDFLGCVSLRGQRVLELGPGHFEFCEAVRRRGGTAEALELDPVVAELGRRRGFRVWPGNLVDLPQLGLDGPYEGLFCKGSSNPFWFHGREDALREYIAEMVRLVRANGWLWVVACPYSDGHLSDREHTDWLAVESRIYAEFGWSAWSVPNRLIGGYYGVSFTPPSLTVYTRGLAPHRWPIATPVRFAGYVLNIARRKLARGFQSSR